MKLDILAVSAHADDVEFAAGGTLLRHVALGHQIGLLDLTRAELSTRGHMEQRRQEALDAARLLGVVVREQLDLRDGFFTADEVSLLKIVAQIRRYRPDIILANATDDRHPDHGRAAQMVTQAAFLAGLVKVETRQDGQLQAPWRPRAVYHYMQDRSCAPSLVVDISAHIEQKLAVLRAYKSQFYQPGSPEPEMPISCPSIFEALRGQNALLGRQIGVEYAEAFTLARPVGVKDLGELL